jgi:hypothetical protein
MALRRDPLRGSLEGAGLCEPTHPALRTERADNAVKCCGRACTSGGLGKYLSGTTLGICKNVRAEATTDVD